MRWVRETVAASAASVPEVNIVNVREQVWKADEWMYGIQQVGILG